tara:strand:- start:701 stop:2410 length:1710 start_codon:yes stop_codon:yes gene_type:complete
MFKNYLFFFETKFLHIFALIFLFIIVSTLEMIGVGTIPILLSVFINPDALEKYFPFNNLIDIFLQNDLKTQLFLISSLIFIVFFSKNFLIFIVNYYKTKFFLNLKLDLTRKSINKVIGNSYRYYLIENNAVLIKFFGTDITRTITYLDKSLVIIQEFLIFIFIVLLLIFTLPTSYILILLISVLSLLLFYNISKNKMKKLSYMSNVNITGLMKNINQIYGSIKEVKIYNKFDFFENKIVDLQDKVQKLEFYSQMINKLPKIILEIVSVTALIAILLFSFNNQKTFVDIVPILGLVAFSLIKIAPSLNSFAASYIQMKAFEVSLEQIKNLLSNTSFIFNKNIKENNNFSFNKKIEVKNLYFNYDKVKKRTLNNVSFELNKGEMVTVTGESGSGKTTLIDLLLGLHDNYDGEILVDGKNILKNISQWHKILAFVPQQVYIFDESLKNNIAFGYNNADINEERIAFCVKMSELENYIKNLPKGIDTVVGDRGKQMSGGQLKRLGIARALYRNPEILILDEATSEVDNITEKRILNNLQNLKKELTIISITHNVKNIDKASKVIKLSQGNLIN